VEKLAGKGLLKAICGTDTLGVGVNVPIRSVLFTQLCKFDGNKTRLLTTREFQQIAGRAGRRGFDDEGFVWCQAPPHVVENLRNEQKAAEAAAKGGKGKKFKKASPPDKGFVMWNEDTFRKGETGAPETLDSSFEVTHGMILAVLSRRGDGKRGMYDLLRKNHEPKIRQRKHQKRAISMYRSLRDAGIVQEAGAMETSGRTVTLGFDLSDRFDLTQPLSLFAVEFLPTLLKLHGEDHASRSKGRDEAYALDVLSTLESVLDTPAAVVNAQVSRLKRRKMARMKDDGVEFDDRIAVLDEMEAPAPLREALESHYEHFRRAHPYVGNETVKPKAVAREMYELGFDFNKYVVHHALNRSEGVVLRYLTDAYKSLVQNVPANLKSDAVEDLEAWLGETIRQVDSSLIDEWEALKDPVAASRAKDMEEAAQIKAAAEKDARVAFSSGRAFRVMVRQRRVPLGAAPGGGRRGGHGRARLVSARARPRAALDGGRDVRTDRPVLAERARVHRRRPRSAVARVLFARRRFGRAKLEGDAAACRPRGGPGLGRRGRSGRRRVRGGRPGGAPSVRDPQRGRHRAGRRRRGGGARLL
jgi:hypothetical protein